VNGFGVLNVDGLLGTEPDCWEKGFTGSALGVPNVNAEPWLVLLLKEKDPVVEGRGVSLLVVGVPKEKEGVFCCCCCCCCCPNENPVLWELVPLEVVSWKPEEALPKGKDVVGAVGVLLESLAFPKPVEGADPKLNPRVGLSSCFWGKLTSRVGLSSMLTS
jgi:hypothetical protein